MLKSWCEFILLICPNYAVRPHAAKHTHRYTHYAQEGRADIWYMRAMINRLIRNGLIKFTLHIKTGSTHDSTYSVLECVRDWLRVCVPACANQRGPSTYLPGSDQSHFPI